MRARRIAAVVGLAALSAYATAHADVVMRMNFPSDARACAGLAERGEASDQAVAACDRALAAQGASRLERYDRMITLLNRGIIHARRQEAAAALADFDAVLRIDRENAQAWLNRGVALVMLGRHGEAVAGFTEALTLGVDQPHLAYFNRAAAREALGDARGALEDYSTALEILPDWGPAEAERQRLALQRAESLVQRLAESDAEPR